VRKAVIGALLIGLLFGPATCLAGLAVLLNPAAQASCLPGAGLSVGAIPHNLSVTTTDGYTFTLNHQQLTHAATIITVGDRTKGVGREGVVIALMAALSESTLEMLSNTSAYPESANHPNDGDGGDHDSLGLFQMRPSTGWGTVADLMDPHYQARAFYGGPTGPNHGSPRGLLDIPGWQEMDNGAAAQAVEVSAYPDRYATFEPVAEKIIEALTGGRERGDDGGTPVPETSNVVLPLPAGVGVKTSGFGIRVHPITGETKLHTGVDYSAPTGTPILATADGRVYFTGASAAYGHIILIDHTVNGQRVSSGYAHMFGERIYVRAGDPVTAGQHIADIGMSGYTTGPHLHFEIRPGDDWSAPVDPEPWLASHGAAALRGAATTTTTTTSGCAA
jgi:murein DD-endopeptidase MepM/ murein hydrolase activator NlpD